MLRIMLCGAQDAERFREDFVQVAVREVCALLARCLSVESEADWKARCRLLHERLSARRPTAHR